MRGNSWWWEMDAESFWKKRRIQMHDDKEWASYHEVICKFAVSHDD
jgi:hypothetical protein